MAIEIEERLIDELAKNEKLFWEMHGIAEKAGPAYRFVHEAVDIGVKCLDIPKQLSHAARIGFSLYEVSTTASGIVVPEIDETLLRVMAATEPTDAIMQTIVSMEEAETRCLEEAPKLAKYSEELASAYLRTRDASVARYAVIGAGLAYSAFTEIDFWKFAEEQMK